MKKRNHNRSGFSLLESLMALSVLSVAAAGVLVPFATGANLRMEGTRITLAAKLASDLLEEVAATDFSEYDVMEWNGFTESKDNMKNFDNILFGDAIYAGFSRKVVCQAAYIGSVECYWVTVRVYYDGIELVELNRLISES